MPQSKYSYTPPGSDESVERMMNSSLGNCHVYSWEAMMLTEALATTTQPREEKKANSGQIIRLGTVVSEILIGLVCLVGVESQSDVVDTPTELHHTSQHQEGHLMNRKD